MHAIVLKYFHQKYDVDYQNSGFPIIGTFVFCVFLVWCKKSKRIEKNKNQRYSGIYKLENLRISHCWTNLDQMFLFFGWCLFGGRSGNVFFRGRVSSTGKHITRLYLEWTELLFAFPSKTLWYLGLAGAAAAGGTGTEAPAIWINANVCQRCKNTEQTAKWTYIDIFSMWKEKLSMPEIATVQKIMTKLINFYSCIRNVSRRSILFFILWFLSRADPHNLFFWRTPSRGEEGNA